MLRTLKGTGVTSETFFTWKNNCQTADRNLDLEPLPKTVLGEPKMTTFARHFFPKNIVKQTMLPADNMGVVRHTKKRKPSCHLQKGKKCINSVSSVKCLGGKKYMTWDICNSVGSTRMLMSTNSHTVHLTFHRNRDSIWVFDYLPAVRIMQNYTFAIAIFQSHMNPFTSLFYLAITQQLLRSHLSGPWHLFNCYLRTI